MIVIYGGSLVSPYYALNYCCPPSHYIPIHLFVSIECFAIPNPAVRFYTVLLYAILCFDLMLCSLLDFDVLVLYSMLRSATDYFNVILCLLLDSCLLLSALLCIAQPSLCEVDGEYFIAITHK